MGFVGQHGLGAVPLEAAPNAVDLQCRADPRTLACRVARLSEALLQPQILQIDFLVKGNAGNGRALIVRKLYYILVKAVHGNASMLIVHGVEQLYQRVDRVLDGAADHARMEI